MKDLLDRLAGMDDALQIFSDSLSEQQKEDQILKDLIQAVSRRVEEIGKNVDARVDALHRRIEKLEEHCGYFPFSETNFRDQSPD